MMAAPVAVIVGAPLSEALLKLDGLVGLKGWQWLFLMFWATFDDVNGVHLARLLARVRAHRPAAPLPRISGLSPDERYALELELVDRSIVYAKDQLGPV